MRNYRSKRNSKGYEAFRDADRGLSAGLNYLSALESWAESVYRGMEAYFDEEYDAAEVIFRLAFKQYQDLDSKAVASRM